MDSGAWKRVASVAELDGDGPFALSADGVDLVVVRVDGQLVAFDGVCPHQGALLGEGEFDGRQLVCRNHRWAFDAATGQRSNGPQCLTACPIEERDAQVLVDVSALVRERHARSGQTVRAITSLPGPARLPLLGSAHKIDPKRMHRIFERWAWTYGPAYRLDLRRDRGLAISSRELIDETLRARPDTFRRVERLHDIFIEAGVHGLFSAEEPEWRPLRRLSMRALANRNLEQFYGTLKVVAEGLHRRWTEAAERGSTIDIEADLKRFTVDVTTWLVFGHDTNTLEQGDDVIQRQLEVVFPAISRRLGSLVPYWRLFRLPRDRALDRAIAEVREFLLELLDKTRARMARDPRLAETPRTFLEAMLAARDENGQPFSDETLLGNGMTMLLAGEDTTAISLAWAVHEMLDTPDAVRALCAEVDAALGPAPVPETLRSANSLAYASAVASETMRLRPVAPIMFFQALHDTTVGDIEVPMGTMVITILRPEALSAENFHEPRTFAPDRWVTPAEAGRAHRPAASIPFGSGPRICPGRSLALLEMRVVLATLYKNFEVERVGQRDQVTERFSFTMVPENLRVRLRPR